MAITISPTIALTIYPTHSVLMFSLQMATISQQEAEMVPQTTKKRNEGKDADDYQYTRVQAKSKHRERQVELRIKEEEAR